MSARQRFKQWGLAVFLVGASAPIAAATADVDGSRDPSSLARFPGSAIVAFSAEAEQRSYDFVTGRVDRSSRDLRVDRGERWMATLLRVTYRAPAGARLDEVAAHYADAVAALDADVAFNCRGRDCGRSTVWANDVFGVKELVAPDSAQFYLAAIAEDALYAVYVVQRGNRRVYAHVDVAGVETRPRTVDAPPDGLADALARQGYAVLSNVEPRADGELAPASLDALDATIGQLDSLAGRTIYVVCHMAGEAQATLRLSRKCAAQAATRLLVAGLDAKPFGAGSMLPRSGENGHRIELVLPSAP